MDNKYKILVLSDMKDTATNAIHSAVSLAKMIDGELVFFHVRNASGIVDQESQLSAIRTINKSYVERGNKIQKLIEPIAKNYNIHIGYNHAFGNVKNEIKDYLQEHKPDVIVLGQRKSNSLNLLGDNITDFVFKNFEGAVLIASDENVLNPNTELSLGILNNDNIGLNMKFVDRLLSHTQKPLKSFKTKIEKNQSNNSQGLEDIKMVEVVFDRGANSIKSLSNYLTKSDVNLLCVNRGDKSDATHLKNVISNVNVSLLFSHSL